MEPDSDKEQWSAAAAVHTRCMHARMGTRSTHAGPLPPAALLNAVVRRRGRCDGRTRGRPGSAPMQRPALAHATNGQARPTPTYACPKSKHVAVVAARTEPARAGRYDIFARHGRSIEIVARALMHIHICSADDVRAPPRARQWPDTSRAMARARAMRARVVSSVAFRGALYCRCITAAAQLSLGPLPRLGAGWAQRTADPHGPDARRNRRRHRRQMQETDRPPPPRALRALPPCSSSAPAARFRLLTGRSRTRKKGTCTKAPAQRARLSAHCLGAAER